MQEYNKRNLIFLLGVFICLLSVFFTVVMIAYIDINGIWAALSPIAMEAYGIYSLVKKISANKDQYKN